MNPLEDSYLNDPTIWIAESERLLTTLKVIERGFSYSSDEEILEAEQSAMLVAGFAFENAIKAWFLKQGGKLYENGELQAFRGHSYADWVVEHKIELQGWESDALIKAQFYSKAQSAYPAHNRRKDERPFAERMWPDVEQMKHLIGRLLADS